MQPMWQMLTKDNDMKEHWYVPLKTPTCAVKLSSNWSLKPDAHLHWIIQTASGGMSNYLPLRGNSNTNNTLYDGERAQRINMFKKSKDVAETGDLCEQWQLLQTSLCTSEWETASAPIGTDCD